MNRPTRTRLLAAYSLLLLTCATGRAATRTWDGGGGNTDWFNNANWSDDTQPAGGDEVVINGGVTVVLSNDSPWLAQLTLTNATLTFTNWPTTLRATNVFVQDGGVLDLPAGFTSSDPSNRINIACTDFTLDDGGTIDANAAGFLATYGPGTGSTADRTRGAGYGGRGGMGQTTDDGGHTYGSLSAPLACGSGGGSTGKGGTGGGAIRIAADGAVTLNGTVSANGGNGLANYGGGGSGGGIYVTCDTLAGTGLIRANGGNGINVSGRGAGGRIAIDYADAGTPWPGLRFQASPGTVGHLRASYPPKPGTLWLSDTTILSEQLGGNLLTDVVVYFDSTNAWASANLAVSNNTFRIGTTGFTIDVSGNVRIDSGADVDVPDLNCGGSVMITNGGALGIHADPTNGATAYGALLAVTNTLSIGASSTLYVESHPTNGGSPLIRVTDLDVAAGGLISGDGGGYAATLGPGAGDAGERRAGGGHGGAGGRGSYVTYKGWPNGTPAGPHGPGSGGSVAERAGPGGALILIDAAGTVTLNGTISANGGDLGNYYSGGGSGGGIEIHCNTFAGSGAGLIRADGGDGASNTSGGGGGGRVSVLYQDATPWPGVRFACSPGAGYTGNHYPFAAAQGSVYLSDTAALGTVMDGDQFTDVTLFISNLTAWTVDSLTVSNCGFRFGPTNFQLTVSNDLTVADAGYLGLVNLDGHHDLIVTNGGVVEVFSAVTNGATPDYGALVTVSNDILVGPSSVLYATSDDKNGGSPKFEAARVVVAAGGHLSADSRGYRGAYGPGRGDPTGRRRGGGYGGQGGDGDSGGTLGLPYGSTNAPLQPGSGGCMFYANAYQSIGGNGGGLIRMDVSGPVQVDGTVSADGGKYNVSNYGGGGSGGGIAIMSDTFSGGTAAAIQAQGGVGSSSTAGGGGGGRIAIAIGLSEANRANLENGNPVAGLTSFSTHSEYLGTLSVTGGLGRTLSAPASTGDDGSQVFLTTALALTVQGDPGVYGSPLPDGYGTTADKSAGLWVTNTVVSPADESAGQRWACLGWELTNAAGTVLGSDTTTQAVFLLNENLFLTWFWTNQYQLTVSAGPNGSVNSGAVNGWYTNAVVVPGIDATADGGYFLSEWVGDVPAGHENDDPLTVTMDQPRTLQASFASLSGETKTWSGTGVWETPANWSPAGLPSAFDSAVITNGSVILGVSRTVRSLVISNGAEMVFTNWDAVLTASSDVRVAGTITLPAAFPDAGPSNRIQIACSNFALTASGVVDADGAGFDTQSGPGRGITSTRGGGAGHGGQGGMGSTSGSLGGDTYDSTNAPSMPGSGGGEPTGGAGGGVVRIDALASAIVDGTVSANGNLSYGSGEPGGGSGGAIWISCTTFGGSNGLIRAQGGSSHYVQHGGGGGGGRIAVTYANLGSPSTPRFDVGHGIGYVEFYGETVGAERGAHNGTLYLSDDSFLASPLTDARFTDATLYMSGVTNWTVADLVVSNCSVRFADEDFSITVPGNVRIDTAGSIGVPQLTCGGDLLLTNGGTLSLHAAPTNAGTKAYGGMLAVTGDVTVASGSWLYPHTHGADGGSVHMRMRNLTVVDTGGIQASGRGFAVTKGPGTGSVGASGRGGGAGYGGIGGIGGTAGSFGGPIYGYTNAPVLPGSGGAGPGGSGLGGYGGGLVWIMARRDVTMDGTIYASGRRTMGYGGGGSGGGIFIECREFSGGATGLMAADGGDSDSNGGGGGGGRIAIWRGVAEEDRAPILADPDAYHPRMTVTDSYSSYAGALSVTNGTGYGAGQPGTAVFVKVVPVPGTMILIK